MDEAEWSSNVDYYELNKDAPFHYSVDEDVEQIALEAEGDSEQVDGEEDVEMGTAIQKEEAKKKKAELKQHCEESKQTVLKVWRERVHCIRFVVFMIATYHYYFLFTAPVHYNKDCVFTSAPPKIL